MLQAPAQEISGWGELARSLYMQMDVRHKIRLPKIARKKALTSASLDCQLHKALPPGQVHFLALGVLRQEDACMQRRGTYTQMHLHITRTISAHHVPGC